MRFNGFGLKSAIISIVIGLLICGGIVVFGMENTPGYVITKDADDFGISERKNTKLYRIPAVAYFFLIGREK